MNKCLFFPRGAAVRAAEACEFVSIQASAEGYVSFIRSRRILPTVDKTTIISILCHRELESDETEDDGPNSSGDEAFIANSEEEDEQGEQYTWP